MVWYDMIIRYDDMIYLLAAIG